MRHGALWRGSLAWGLLAAAACKPALPSSYPDTPRVAAAQKKWCAMLAGVLGDRFDWRPECEAATPTGSAAFITAMARCYQRQLAELRQGAPDSGALVAMCSDEILAAAEPGQVSHGAVIEARCARMQRCQQIEPATCRTAFEQLDGMQRATFTSMYNLRAQALVARCLDETPCSEDEDRAHADCYDGVFKGRVWLPLALGPDESTAPLSD